MKLYLEQIPNVARDVLRQLIAAGEVEVENLHEAQLDVEAILKEHVRQDREITDRAKQILEKRSLGYDQFSKIRRTLAEERGLGDEEELLGHLISQIYEILMRSPHVAEVYVEEGLFRRRLQKILQEHGKIDDTLDQEVRQRIKNLQEGTASWEIEYKKVMDQVKRKHNL